MSDEDRIDFIITTNEIGLDAKYGEYGEDEYGQGKTLSGILQLKGSITPAVSPEVLLPKLDEYLDQAFDKVIQGVKRATERASKEESGW